MFKTKWLWIAIVAFGVIPPVIILLLYDYSVSGTVFSLYSKGVSGSLSKESGHWSDFGSLLSGVFTLLGAIASLATLIFLLQQQKKGEQDRLEQLRIQRDIQNKSDEHLHSEKELMNFEMYKIHKDMFDSLLDNLEKQMNNGMKFVSRSFLYKNIFPDNGFYHFNGKATLDNKCILPSLINDFKHILSTLPNINCIISANAFFANFNMLNSNLGLKGGNDFHEFDVIFRNKFIGINIFDIRDGLYELSQVIDELLGFSENECMGDFHYPDGWYSSLIYLYAWGGSSLMNVSKLSENSLGISIAPHNSKGVIVITHIINKCEELMKVYNYNYVCYEGLKKNLMQLPICKSSPVGLESILIKFSININDDLFVISQDPSLINAKEIINYLSCFVSQQNILNNEYPLNYP